MVKKLGFLLTICFVIALNAVSTMAMPNYRYLFICKSQEYIDKNLPTKDDGYFKEYVIDFNNDFITSRVDPFGDLYIYDGKTWNFIKNINIPFFYDGAYTASFDGSYAIDGDIMYNYVLGKTQHKTKLSSTIPGIKTMTKYFDDFFLVLGKDGNVYTIETNGTVHKLTSSGNIVEAVFTNYLPCEKIEISVRNKDDVWYITENVFEPNWIKTEGMEVLE